MNRRIPALLAMLWLGVAACAGSNLPHLRLSLNNLREVSRGDASSDRAAGEDKLIIALVHLEMQAPLESVYPHQLRAIHDVQAALALSRKGVDWTDVQAQAAEAGKEVQGALAETAGQPHLTPDVPPNPQTMKDALELVEQAMVTDPPKQAEYIQLAFDLVLLNPEAGNFRGYDGIAAGNLRSSVHPYPGETAGAAEYLRRSAVALKAAIAGAAPDSSSLLGSSFQPDKDTAQTKPPPASDVPLPADVLPSLVRINGDRSNGLGILVRMDAVTGILTDFQLVSENPHLQITTAAGEAITPGDLKIATDRNLAFFAVSSPVYPYVTVSSGTSAKVDDAVTIADRNPGADSMAGLGATILAVGAQRIAFNTDHEVASGGGPVLNSGGQVIGIMAGTLADPPPDSVGPGSFNLRRSQQKVHHYGLRLDNIAAWEACGANELASEAAFLVGFGARSRALDALLNAPPADDDSAGAAAATHLFQQDAAIHAALDNYRRFIIGADPSQRKDGLEELLGDLQTAARTDLATIQQPGSFHGYNQQRAAGELAYRQALLKELDDISNDPDHMSRLPK